ncbi:MAG: aryl-sulfate sulfotransferase, partial [Saprospiraceae bacterium]|nr:aryl-sulfate sulfotransferase [Saprospiraceae bacterium]
DGGMMLRTFKPPPEGPFTSASNAGGLELVDWDNNIVWSYQINTPTQLSHHDAVAMPNGHLLVLTWELVFTDELVALGRDPEEIAPQGFMWSERILELKPSGADGAEIVWEWQIKDHYVQQFDATKAGYGIVADHPELFDINLPDLNSPNSNASRDWNHFNAIDYHPQLDQILISTRNSDEIWILDHSTTTAEAAGHSGGMYGKGGDILYRWGNASAYDRAPVSEQKLFGQHGAQWVDEGLSDEGRIILFNNGNGRPGPDFSTVEIIAPPQDSSGGYPVPADAPFGPSAPHWVYGDEAGETFYSAYLSNAQRLPNGNTLVNVGSPGTIFEINQDRQVVWKYVIPLNGDFPGTQGQNISNNAAFRAYKYTAGSPQLSGQDLTPGSTIESGTDPADCMLSTGVARVTEVAPRIMYIPGRHALNVRDIDVPDLHIVLLDLAGRQVAAGKFVSGYLSLPAMADGIYVVSGTGLPLAQKILIVQR